MRIRGRSWKWQYQESGDTKRGPTQSAEPIADISADDHQHGRDRSGQEPEPDTGITEPEPPWKSRVPGPPSIFAPTIGPFRRVAARISFFHPSQSSPIGDVEKAPVIGLLLSLLGIASMYMVWK